jgi:glyoxalase family protein
MRLEGIHHISCITGDARANMDFYTGVLGLRLVAKSVNQDDPTVYHLFYADEEGNPGSDLTFFEYPGALPGRAGRGMVHRILFRVADAEALGFWERRLGDHGVDAERHGATLRFRDGEGLEFELVIPERGDPPLSARHPEIPVEFAIQGFDGVRAYGTPGESGRAVLEAVMGARPTGKNTWELAGSKRGATIAYDTHDEVGRQGAGTVHHVAWHTTAEEHPRWFERLRAMGVSSTPIIDRHYFHSIYFREPVGVLFEIADDAPGFTVDDQVQDLGRRVILPPFLEPRRSQIETILTPLPDPRAGWPTA